MRQKRTGFTLVELLVVIAIIGILVALLLPAVQAAREAARRMSCGNNMKQLALSLHNYHDTFKKFPPAAIWNRDRFVVGTTPAAGTQRNFTWISMVLPYIEQGNLHDQLDFSVPIWDQRNAQGELLRATRIPSLECPSDPAPDTTDDTHDISWTSYSGSEGWDWWGRPGHQVNGVFTFKQSGVKFRDIVDGTSNTIAIGETGFRSTHDCHSPPLTSPANVAGGNGCVRAGNVAVFRAALVATQTHPTVAAQHSVNGGCGMLNPDGSTMSGWWASGATPYAYKPTFFSAYGINSPQWANAHSMHPGGAQFGLADGSVRFVSETINTGSRDAYGRNGNLWAAINDMQGHPDAVQVTWD